MEIHHYKTEITFLRKHIRPVKEIISHIHMTESDLVNKKTKVYIDDLNDLITQATEAIEIYYTMVSDMLNICHTNISNKVNDVMKVLTIYAAIFIPLTLITGIYGTNFDYIPELHYRYSYYIMLGCMGLIALGMIFYFRRKKWL